MDVRKFNMHVDGLLPTYYQYTKMVHTIWKGDSRSKALKLCSKVYDAANQLSV